MGYNVQTTAFSAAPNIEGLRRMDFGMSWRVFAAPEGDAWLMDYGYGPKAPGPVHWDAAALFAPRETPPLPMASDCPREDLELLTDLAESARLISENAQSPTFTCLSNDEGNDAIAVAADGHVRRVRTTTVLIRDEGNGYTAEDVVQYGLDDGEATRTLLTTLRYRESESGIVFEDKSPNTPVLNETADKELERFLGRRLPMFDDNYIDVEKWGWPLIAAAPEHQEQGFLSTIRKLFRGPKA